MKLKQLSKLFKRASSVLLSALLLTTSLPVSSVYAERKVSSVTNQGAVGATGGASTEECDKFGGFKTEGVRCYIYDKDTGEFIASESTYDDNKYNGKKAIDFLGYQNVYEWYFDGTKANKDNISYETEFGTLDEKTVQFSKDWPFTKDGTDYYFANYEWVPEGQELKDFAGNNLGINEGFLTGTTYTNEMLKENNGQKLSDIIKTYWGDSVDAVFKTSESLMWCAEPIYIVSYSYGDEVDDPSVYPLYFESREPTVTTYQLLSTTIYPVITGEEQQHNHKDRTATRHGQEVEIHTTGWTWNELKNSYSWSTLSEYDKQLIDEDNEINGSYYDHYDIETYFYYETETEHHYRGYDYDYGTARTIHKQSSTYGGERKYAWNFDIAYKSCDAVYVAGVGKDKEYNNDFTNLIFADNEEGSTSVPTFQGNIKCLDIDGTPTTWGLYFLSSVEFGGITFQTNNPLTDRPSTMSDPDSDKTRINYSHNGGFKNILKIYEDRNSETGKLIKASSYFTKGAPNIMEIVDESTDQWLPIECSEHEGKQCRKSWFNWYKKHSDEGYILDEDGKSLFLKGSGYTTSDWCVLAGLSQDEDSVKNQQNIAVNLTGSEYKTVVRAYEIAGAHKSNTGVGNKHYVSMNDDDNILVIRYVKYSDSTVPNLFNYDSVLTESQLTSVAKLDSTINDFKLGSKMFQANSLSGDDLVDDSLSLGIGVNLHNESKYLDSILGYESVQHSATRPNTNLYKKSVGGNGVSIGITRRQSDATGNDIVGISDVSVPTIAKDGKTVVNEKGSDLATSAINGLFGTTRGNVATVETPSDNTLNMVSSNLGTSADMNTEIITGVSLTDGSNDNITRSNTDDANEASLVSDADKTSIKDGVQYRTADSSINVSSIKKNESGINGSMQSNTVMMGIQPLIKMGYTSLENNSYKTGNTMIATNNIREIAVNSYAGITYLGSISIIVESNTWAIDNILTNGDKAWNKPGQVLKGGSIVTLGTAGKSNTINIYSAQLVNDGSDYSNSGLVSYSEDTSIDTVKSYHEEYKDSVIDNLKQTYLTQWLSNNTSNTSTPAYEDSGAVKVSGLENDDFYNPSNGYSNTNPFNSNGLELQPDSKYWLNSGNSNTADSGRFDITQEKTTYKYYKFITNYDGRVYMLTSNEPEFKNPTVSLLLESNQGYSDLKNEDALRIDQQTNILQNMLNTAIRHQGNDSGNEAWSSLNDGRWYNEVLSATVLVQNTAVDIGINMPNKRMHVIDTSLEPYSDSKLTAGDSALKTCWTTNWSNLQKLGTFRNVPISLDKAMQMFKSRNTYICNMSVQDN